MAAQAMGRSIQTEQAKDRVLRLFADLGRVDLACAQAGVARLTHYYWMHHDPSYALRFKQAQELAAQVLEDEIVRRAQDGVSEPVFYLGKVCGTVTKYSDTLAIFLLKKMRPEYRDHSTVQHTGAIHTVNANININANMDLKALSPDELATLEGLVAKAVAAAPQLPEAIDVESEESGEDGW